MGLFIDLIKSGRILTTSCFSGVQQHYLRQNGAFVPCSKVETVALFENHFGMDVPLEATGRLSTAMKQYMTHKLGGASINTSENPSGKRRTVGLDTRYCSWAGKVAPGVGISRRLAY